ncbi:MAG TPA: hypothetical protein VGJ84_06835, partial [Polyangiaceae bacterium]
TSDLHACALRADGTLWCWGDNEYGTLGDGTTVNRSSPVQVTALGASVASVAPGATCAVDRDSALWCWGINRAGQVGDGTTIDRSTPVRVTALGDGVAQGASGWTTCALKRDGTLWCWGANEYGQVGDGTTVDKSTPLLVAALGTNVAGVTVGPGRTCAFKQDGTLWCWGMNLSASGPPQFITSKDYSTTPMQVPGLDGVVSVVLSDYACVLRGGGTVWCWGNNAYVLGVGLQSPVQVTGLGTEVSAIAAGTRHACAVKNDGTLWCWGINGASVGVLGIGTALGTRTMAEKSDVPLRVTVIGNAQVATVAAELTSHASARKMATSGAGR